MARFLYASKSSIAGPLTQIGLDIVEVSDLGLINVWGRLGYGGC